MAPTTTTTNIKGVHSRRGSGKDEAMRRRAIVRDLMAAAMDDEDDEVYHTDIRAAAQTAMNKANIRHCKDSIPAWIFIKTGEDNIWKEGFDVSDTNGVEDELD